MYTFCYIYIYVESTLHESIKQLVKIYIEKKCPINTTAVLGNHNLTSCQQVFIPSSMDQFSEVGRPFCVCPPDLPAHRRARAVAAHTGVPVSGRVDFPHLANNCSTIRQMTFSLGHRHSLTLQDHFSQTKGIQPVPHLDPKFKVPCNKDSFSFYLRQVLKQFFFQTVYGDCHT